MAASDRAGNEVAEDSRSPWRRRLLLWALPLAVTAVAVVLYGSSGRYASTDNAYVQRDRVDVAPQVSGDVREVHVAENQHVAPGDLVLVLDDTLQKIAVAAAESRLTSARAEIESARVSYREKGGEIEVAKSAALYAQRDLKRQEELMARQLTSQSALDAARRMADLSTGGIEVLELQRRQILARFGGDASLPADAYGPVRTALADLARARVDLEHTRIVAPQAGIASHLPKVGSRVDAGKPAFAVVSDKSVWVEANFKETDLEWVRPGEPVRVVIDTYPDRDWHGRVESISQATGAEFSLLPPQNASGNWVKVVQRIAVRVALDLKADDPPLRDGMSATVEIDTGPHTRFDRWFGRH
ncbi:MAG: HlyD family secretion protein [Proteobacteria bacterium]|nr:HlyD family secretion protein [Pseudomonadota bacterium]